jgi:hypothetical protein
MQTLQSYPKTETFEDEMQFGKFGQIGGPLLEFEYASNLLPPSNK